ncbi:LysR family transcriptional regulator [Clostridium sp. MCC353]|uniref:LysR family transcriptional regulator n=1 Tax=Clostridium sp. MCC353 TaxID=2592646 RepID=UPI001C026DEA|nr:LysR family transcriptional regulator [Clostridium sp. MCC353]MBT9776083.1 LysR family transcriptional regulator [Clostridium sp. MCC353]
MQQEMKYIYQIYEDGSFSKAAEHLFITQPALSIAVSKIEASLGMALFDRRRHPLQPTAAGQAYIDTIKKIKMLEDDLECRINDMRDLNTGTIRIGGSHYLNAYILPKILADFSREYPGIRLELVEKSSGILADMLSEQNLDLTFSCNETFIKDFERYPAFWDTILLAVPREYEINQQLSHLSLSASDIINKKHMDEDCPSVSLTEFRELEYILLSEENNLYERSMKMFKDAGFSPRIKMTLSQLVTAYHLAADHFAAAFISDRLVRDTAVPLVFYKIKSEYINRLFYLLIPDRNYTSMAVKAFIQYFLLNV